MRACMCDDDDDVVPFFCHGFCAALVAEGATNKTQRWWTCKKVLRPKSHVRRCESPRVCLPVCFISSGHLKRVELDAGAGEGVHGQPAGGQLPALAGVRQCHRRDSLLPR